MIRRNARNILRTRLEKRSMRNNSRNTAATQQEPVVSSLHIMWTTAN